MDALAIITRLEAILTEERAAIARLDGTRVTALADEKKRLAVALEGRPTDERSQVAVQLKRLVRDLRINGVLITQARAILIEAIFGPSVTIPQLARANGRWTASRPPRHLSIRG